MRLHTTPPTEDVEWKEVCSITLKPDDVDAFDHAIDDDYYFEMFLDSLPVWGYVGEIDEDTDVINALRHPSQLFSKRHLIYTHLHFSIGYNAAQIVQVNISTNPNERQDLSDKSLTFSYSVEWVPSTLQYKDRMLRYASNSFLPAALEIHWLSIINSFVLVLLLTAFLTIILMRILKNDFARYMAVEMGEEAGEAEGNESGWKLLRGDVFRFPPYVGLLAACVGNGVQLFVLCFCLLSVSLLGTFGPHKRGAVVTALIILYALTSGVSGFVSAQLYKKLNGQTWVWNIVGSAVLFPSVVSACFIFLNSTAWAHGSTAALPFGTIVIIILLYLLVALPLSIIGGIAGRNTTGALEPPCRTNFTAKELPEVPWCVRCENAHSLSLSLLHLTVYLCRREFLRCATLTRTGTHAPARRRYRNVVTASFMAGFLPFSAIYIELRYMFASMWGHKIYTLFGILFIAFIMLIIVTSFITIALTYFQLAVEDYRWWWRSFITGGSTGFFVYAYCFFYFFARSAMFGFVQTSFFFGYMFCISFGFFLMLGSIGFFSAFRFVHYIYSSIKCD